MFHVPIQRIHVPQPVSWCTPSTLSPRNPCIFPDVVLSLIPETQAHLLMHPSDYSIRRCSVWTVASTPRERSASPLSQNNMHSFSNRNNKYIYIWGRVELTYSQCHCRFRIQYEDKYVGVQTMIIDPIVEIRRNINTG